MLHGIRATLVPVANVTLTLDDEVLRRARIRALEQGTSVNALVREYLTEYSGEGAARDALRGALDVMEKLDAGSGPGGRDWTREELYAERAGWQGPLS